MRYLHTTTRLVLLGVILAVLVITYAVFSRTGVTDFLEDGTALQAWFRQLGQVGPLAIIGLLALAIVLSPIPSAPIALAAGAAYGHTVGTLYVVLGAELGAVIAFAIARLAGEVTVQRWFGPQLSRTMNGSQTTLMWIVFFSRLMPFISFDMVSYAAGITPLHLWRFVIATLAGIVPASFLLAHFGAEMASGEYRRIATTLLLLGALSFGIALWKRHAQGKD